MPNFSTWPLDQLIQFAEAAYKQIQQDHDLIQQLQCERKDAIKAYREILIARPGAS
jgi:hypothetical protein